MVNAKTCIVVDEFAALLDRPLAKVLSFNLRRLVTKTTIGALVATTHEDIEESANLKSRERHPDVELTAVPL